MLGHQTRRPFARGPWIDRKAAQARAKHVVDGFDVRERPLQEPLP